MTQCTKFFQRLDALKPWSRPVKTLFRHFSSHFRCIGGGWRREVGRKWSGFGRFCRGLSQLSYKFWQGKAWTLNMIPKAWQGPRLSEPDQASYLPLDILLISQAFKKLLCNNNDLISLAVTCFWADVGGFAVCCYSLIFIVGCYALPLFCLPPVYSVHLICMSTLSHCVRT